MAHSHLPEASFDFETGGGGGGGGGGEAAAAGWDEQIDDAV